MGASRVRSFAGSANSDTGFSVRGSPNKSSDLMPSSLTHSNASAFDPFQPSFVTSFPSYTEFSVHDAPGKSKTPSHQHSSAADFDPFAAIPVKTLDESDSFSAFSSNTVSGQTKTESLKCSYRSPFEELNFGAFTSHTESPRTIATKLMNKSPTKLEPASMSESKSDVKKGAFQVKSGIWADSLSRGLIDLNITACKYLYIIPLKKVCTLFYACFWWCPAFHLSGIETLLLAVSKHEYIYHMSCSPSSTRSLSVGTKFTTSKHTSRLYIVCFYS